MADRFPSIEDLDAGQAPASTNGESGGDFLARERAALGEDADLFASAQDGAVNRPTVEDADDDLLGGGDDFGAAPTSNQDSQFESHFPAIETHNAQVGPGGTITGSTAPFQSGISQGYTNYKSQADEEDSEFIRTWREKRDAEIERRAATSQEKTEEKRKKAREDLDAFYESYNRKMEKQQEQVSKQAKEFTNNIENTAAGGTAWERIAKLADAKNLKSDGDGSRKRMREILLELAKDQNAPGATVA